MNHMAKNGLGADNFKKNDYISSIKGKSVVIFMERKRGLPVKTVHIRAYGGGPAVA